MTTMHNARLLSLVLPLSLLAASACGRADSPPGSATNSAGAVQASSSTPPVVGRDLRALRWIEGTWRGEGDAQPAFYERYRLTDDSTLVVESFSDSTIARTTETTRFQLRDGRLTSASGASAIPGRPAPRWFADVLTADSVRFQPLVAARNSFVWHRGGTPDSWTAIIRSASSSSRPSRTVTYTMRRWR